MPTRRVVNEDPTPKKVSSEELSEEESLIRTAKAVPQESPTDPARDLHFMSQMVDVMILPSYDKADTTKLVTISVNGKEWYFMRGEWRKVPRYVLEVIATAKHQAWQFGYRTAINGQTVQTQDSSIYLRYPHQFRDPDPRGIAWYDSIKDTHR